MCVCLQHAVCGILDPRSGTEPEPSRSESTVLTTGLPENSQESLNTRHCVFLGKNLALWGQCSIWFWFHSASPANLPARISVAFHCDQNKSGTKESPKLNSCQWPWSPQSASGLSETALGLCSLDKGGSISFLFNFSSLSHEYQIVFVF